jgi:hypothetical protein
MRGARHEKGVAPDQKIKIMKIIVIIEIYQRTATLKVIFS